MQTFLAEPSSVPATREALGIPPHSSSEDFHDSSSPGERGEEPPPLLLPASSSPTASTSASAQEPRLKGALHQLLKHKRKNAAPFRSPRCEHIQSPPGIVFQFPSFIKEGGGTLFNKFNVIFHPVASASPASYPASSSGSSVRAKSSVRIAKTSARALFSQQLGEAAGSAPPPIKAARERELKRRMRQREARGSHEQLATSSPHRRAQGQGEGEGDAEDEDGEQEDEARSSGRRHGKKRKALSSEQLAREEGEAPEGLDPSPPRGAQLEAAEADEEPEEFEDRSSSSALPQASASSSAVADAAARPRPPRFGGKGSKDGQEAFKAFTSSVLEASGLFPPEPARRRPKKPKVAPEPPSDESSEEDASHGRTDSEGLEEEEDASESASDNDGSLASPSKKGKEAGEKKHRSRGLGRNSPFVKKVCASCGTTKTPYWRDGWHTVTLCNACGIRYQKYRMRCPNCIYIPRKDETSNTRCNRCGHPMFMK